MALTLSLTAMAKFGGMDSTLITSKFAVWCFFVGLVLSGLHLVTSAAFQWGTAAHSLKEELQEASLEIRQLIKTREDITAAAIRGGLLDKNIVDQVRELSDQQRKISSAHEENLQRFSTIVSDVKMDKIGAILVLQFFQELMLWGSYLSFVVGAYSAISAL